jgi:Ca-activated chloride channel family protein
MFSSGVFLAIVSVGALMAGTYVLLGALGRRDPRKRPSRSSSPWRRRIPAILLVGAVACLALAVAQFRLHREVKDADVMLTMDVSDSMNATDVLPDRLSAAEDAANAFLRQVPAGFRVGLVSFASDVKVVVPPTISRDEVGSALAGLSTSRGTFIGDGLTSSLDAIEQDWQQNGDRPAAIVLLSDGQDTGSFHSPTDAADRARSIGVPVYTVVLGDPNAPHGADAALLQDVAERTQATSFSAGSASQLTSVYTDLGSHLSVDLAISSGAQLFVIAAIVLAIGAGLALLAIPRPQY